MTDFCYNNEERLLQLQEEILGEGGKIEQTITPENLDVYKFLISMSIERGLHISKKSYMQVKKYAILADCTVPTIVFFEKCDSYSRDTLYFQNFMKKASRDKEFLGVYQTHFNRVA